MSPPRPRTGNTMNDGTDDVLDPAGSSFTGHAPSPLGTVPLTMPPPIMFGGPTSPLAPISPRRGSPFRTAGRRDYSTKTSSHFSRVHQFVEQPGYRTSGKGSNHALPASHNHAQPRGPSQTPPEPLTDPTYQLARHGPPPNLRSSTTSTSGSSLSSTFSSSAATPNSTYTSLTSMEDVRSQRSQRSLPPLSTVGLEPLANPIYTDASQPHFSSPTYLPNSHTLPPPLHSPFLSSSSSGKPGMSRDSGGGSPVR